MVEVVVSERAAAWLRDAEPDVRDRIREKLHDAAEFPGHYLRRLSGSEYYRLRVGDYRSSSTGAGTTTSYSCGRSVTAGTSTTDGSELTSADPSRFRDRRLYTPAGRSYRSRRSTNARPDGFRTTRPDDHDGVETP